MGGAWGKRDGAWGGERGSRRDARGGEPGRAASSPKDLGLWRRDPSIEGVELVRGLGLQVVHTLGERPEQQKQILTLDLQRQYLLTVQRRP